MKYCELKEMTIKEWDGTPFKAYVTDKPDETIDPRDINNPETIVSFDSTHAEPWKTAYYNHFMHVYPVEWNQDIIASEPKRMTNLQLAQWLAKGNGQLSVNALARGVHMVHSYALENELDECSANINVRKWGSSEWIEPTVDLLDKS